MSTVVNYVDVDAQRCDERYILRERGQREVFCGLTSIVWLHRKLQDAFFLVIGSRTCAHLIQSAAGVMIFAQPRFATAILDDRDLSGIADCHDEIDRTVTELLQRRPEIRTLFLVGSCPSEVIKLDLRVAVRRLNRRLHGRTRVLSFSGSGIETTFTQGEDECLKALVESMPVDASGSGRKRRLLVVGALADDVEHQFSRLFDAMGIDFCFLPGNRADQLPEIDEHTGVLLAQPFLGDTLRALMDRGARHIEAPFPIGINGTTAWLQAAAEAFYVSPERFAEVIAKPVSRAEQALDEVAGSLAGCSASFLPDSQLEFSIARFLAEECGMRILEVGTPRLDRQIHDCELRRLPESTRISEGQDVNRQLDRLVADAPDLVVCGLGLANPLEALGLRTKWSIELVFSPIQGFEHAADLAALFARPLERHARLQV